MDSLKEYKTQLISLDDQYKKIIRSLKNGTLVFRTALDIEKYGIELQDKLKSIGINRYKFLEGADKIILHIRTLKFASPEQETEQKILGEYNKIIIISDECIDLIKIIQELLKKYKILKRPTNTGDPEIRKLRKEILGNKMAIAALIKERDEIMTSGLYGSEAKRKLDLELEKLNNDILKRETELHSLDPDLSGVVVVQPTDYLTEVEETKRSVPNQWFGTLRSYLPYFPDGIKKSKRKSKTKTSRRRKSKTKTSRRRKSKTKTSRKRKTKRRTRKSRF